MLTTLLKSPRLKRFVLQYLLFLVALMALSALFGCGGGDPEPQERARVDPPVCGEQRELCK